MRLLGWYLVWGVCLGLAGFPCALSVDVSAQGESYLLHVLCWYVGLAHPRRSVKQGGEAWAS